jgi:hypothetical protein
MVQAPQEVIDAINNGTARGEFAMVPDGMYLCRIHKVTEYPPTAGGSGFGGVQLQWKIIQPRQYAGTDEDGNSYGDLFLRLSWSPKAAFKIEQFWDALGYSYDSDFDEPVEEQEEAVLVVSQGIISSGKRKGEISLNVDEILEPTADLIAKIAA